MIFERRIQLTAIQFEAHVLEFELMYGLEVSREFGHVMSTFGADSLMRQRKATRYTQLTNKLPPERKAGTEDVLELQRIVDEIQGRGRQERQIAAFVQRALKRGSTEDPSESARLA